LQCPSQTNGDNLSNVRCKTSRTFKNKKREYLKEKSNELETNSKNGYQPRTNLVKDGNGDLLADYHNILNRWQNYFCKLLNVHGVNDVRHTVESLVPEPSYFKVEMAIGKLKRYKSPDTDQILEKLTQAGSNTLHSEIHKLFNSIWINY
jgi:hypothetical protein